MEIKVIAMKFADCLRFLSFTRTSIAIGENADDIYVMLHLWDHYIYAFGIITIF